MPHLMGERKEKIADSRAVRRGWDPRTASVIAMIAQLTPI